MLLTLGIEKMNYKNGLIFIIKHLDCYNSSFEKIAKLISLKIKKKIFHKKQTIT